MGRTKDSKRFLQLSINMSETSAPARLQVTYQEAGTMPNGVLSQGPASGLARTPAKLSGNRWAGGNSTMSLSLSSSIHLLSEFPCLEPSQSPSPEINDVQGNRETPREPGTEALLQNNHPLNTRLLSPPKPACFVHFSSCIRVS